MSININITIPSAKVLQDSGWARNALFRVVESGGTIDNNDLMDIWRLLEGNARCKWATAATKVSQFDHAPLQEMLVFHKRSSRLCENAFMRQHCLPENTVNNLFVTWAEGVQKKLLRQRSQRYPLYGAGTTALYRFTSAISYEKSRNIDELDEDTLYTLSQQIADLVAAFELSRPSARSSHHFVSTYLDALATGTRESLVLPLLASTNSYLSAKAESAYITIGDNNEQQ